MLKKKTVYKFLLKKLSGYNTIVSLLFQTFKNIPSKILTCWKQKLLAQQKMENIFQHGS